MMGMKISGKTVQVAAMNLTKELSPAFKKAGTYVEPVVQAIKKHPVEVTAGVIGTGLVADDLHQRHRNSVLKRNIVERERKTREVLKKHEAELQVKKVEADKTEDLIIINKQLCDAIRALKEKADDKEKENTGGTAD